MNAARRASLRAVVIALFATAANVRAQDPRATAAVAAARDWLALVDRNDIAASYAATGAKFRKTVSDKQWAALHAKERQPRGTMNARALFQTAFGGKLPQTYGPGEYISLAFRTSFSNQPDARETVTLERESDGAWRVIGYFIR